MIAPSERAALARALEEAARFVGATAPNPPVGAAALDASGALLAVRAHERAGLLHAEAQVLADCRALGVLERIHTLVVTLEPCNHHGRTPPCTEALLSLPNLRRVVYGQPDPNPRVAGGGAERLRQAGIDCVALDAAAEPALFARCQELLAPFRHWILTGRPWVTVKTAHRRDGGSMIPAPGTKTFTSPESLRFAHELRRRADAILTGSGTVLADDPQFTVRLLPDHPGKRRWLVVLDRRGRVPENTLKQAESRGFQVLREPDLATALTHLGKLGCLEVLVEAGPTLSQAILAPPLSDQRGCLWNAHVVITQGTPDHIEVRLSGG